LHTPILKIDRALYAVDDETKTYRFYCRNPDWEKLGAKENARNKKHISGYARIFRDGKKRVFRYRI